MDIEQITSKSTFFCLVSYTQGPIKGDADNEGGHVHEGIQLAARDGFVAVGETLEGNPKKVLDNFIVLFLKQRNFLLRHSFNFLYHRLW